LKKKGKTPNLKKDFDILLLDAIDEALSAIGEPPKKAIYCHLEREFGIKREEIPKRQEDFSNALEKMFGLGAKHMEIMIMKTLHKKTRKIQDWNAPDWVTPELTYLTYIKMKKQAFTNTEVNSVLEVFVATEEENKQYT
jgi:hypothetical protein